MLIFDFLLDAPSVAFYLSGKVTGGKNAKTLGRRRQVKKGERAEDDRRRNVAGLCWQSIARCTPRPEPGPYRKSAVLLSIDFLSAGAIDT